MLFGSSGVFKHAGPLPANSDPPSVTHHSGCGLALDVLFNLKIVASPP